MKLRLHVLSLSANLPFGGSQISFLISNNGLPNQLSDDLNCNLKDQYVLMSDVTEITFTDTHFFIQLQNPEQPKKIELSVLATSVSTLNPVYLGSVHIDIRKLMVHQIQNGFKKAIKEPLLDVDDQQGNLTFDIHIIQPQISLSHQNLKSTESLDREQTCSSDSYEANLKDLNKITYSEETEDFSPKFKQSLENHYRNVDYANKIILEEIDLEDDEDDDLEDIKTQQSLVNHSKKLNEPHRQDDSLRNRLQEEKLKIQFDIHNLQESDFFLIRIEQKLRLFVQ